jgi:hypothetical protein
VLSSSRIAERRVLFLARRIKSISGSNAYHWPSDRWYRKTKQGEYMQETHTVWGGNHADHGKACSS